MLEERYREIVAAVDAEFERNRARYGERIHCRAGCSKCCYHVFAISALEAEQIAEGIQRLEPERRKVIESKAREYIAVRLVRGDQAPCPALDGDVCSIYEFRPLMCHKFGMPLYNPEKPDRIFACELNFGDGDEIDDSQLIQIQSGIHREWKQLQSEYAQSRLDQPARMTVAHAVLMGHNR